MTATEWARDFGGYRKESAGMSSSSQQQLPFECCALTLLPFEAAACTRQDGVLCDAVALLEYVKAHGTSPVTGEKVEKRDVLLLKTAKNAQGRWHCPLTYRVFGKHSKVAAIGTTGNVFAYEALRELNVLKTRLDPLDGTPFAAGDLLIVHDPDDADLCRRRDLSHRRLHRDEGNVRHSETAVKNERILAEARRNVAAEDDERRRRRRGEEEHTTPGLTETFRRVRDVLRPLTEDVLEGSKMSGGATARAATSSAVDVSTRSDLRCATEAELMAARYKVMRKCKKRGYVRLETNFGPLNLELRFDVAPRACENFIGLCRNGAYDDTVFHRIIKGFVVQGGDPTGEGHGGQSLWGAPFADEVDVSRLRFDARGVLAYANAGKRDQNKSQFFLTLAPCPHLDGKHTIFGKLVGGNDTLDQIEVLRVAEDHRPVGDSVLIRHAIVFADPVPDADNLFEDTVAKAIASRQTKKKAPNNLAVAKTGGRGGAPPSVPKKRARVDQPQQRHTALTIGKYLPSSAAQAQRK